MKTFYKVGGILNKGFVGQISYTVCLDKTYESMELTFSFDEEKRRHAVITPEIKAEFIAACNGQYGMDTATDAQVIDAMGQMKTEIHTIATMNDCFIGGIHRQLTTRHMRFAPGQASEGCIPQASIHGVIKLTLVVFNVIMDDTHYEVILSVNE